MSLSSIRIITEEVDRLAAFYERVTGAPAERPAPVFAQFTGRGATLAIASVETVAMLGDAMSPRANHSVFIEFEVADVDAEFARLRPESKDVVLAPTTMPWGNRSTLIRDPDDNIVNLFSRPAG